MANRPLPLPPARAGGFFLQPSGRERPAPARTADGHGADVPVRASYAAHLAERLLNAMAGYLGN